MRDIRGDLQDRAALLGEQINAHEAQFDQLIEQLKREHDTRLEDFRAELDAVNRLGARPRLRRIEQRRTRNSSGKRTAPYLQPAQPQLKFSTRRKPSTRSASARLRMPRIKPRRKRSRSGNCTLADFHPQSQRAGAMSRDDLGRFSLQRGLFRRCGNRGSGACTTLLSVVKAGLIRQLPNGNFAPATRARHDQAQAGDVAFGGPERGQRPCFCEVGRAMPLGFPAQDFDHVARGLCPRRSARAPSRSGIDRAASEARCGYWRRSGRA